MAIPRRPQGNKVIIPVDTNIVNAFIEIAKFESEHPTDLMTDPTILPNAIFCDKEDISESDDIKLNGNKLVCYALYSLITTNQCNIFISPIVLNEIRNISYKPDRDLFIDFIKNHGVMPAVEFENGKAVICGSEDVDILARAYCEPYDFTVKKDGIENTFHSNYGPMEYVANENLIESSETARKPAPDAYAMAWAAVFLKNFITLNEKHFINVNQRMSDGKRRKGISTITQKVLGCSDYDVAVPLSPSEIYVAFRRYTHQKQNGKEYRLDLSDIKDFSPINLGDFFNFILKKFEKSDMSFYDSLEDVVKKLNIKNVLDDGQTVSVSSFDSAMLIETDDELSDDNII